MDMQQKTNAKVLRSRSHQAYLDEVRSDQRELLHLAVNTNIIDERSPSKHKSYEGLTNGYKMHNVGGDKY